MKQTPLLAIPLTLPKANDFVLRLHRHHAPLPGGFCWFAVGAVSEGQIVGAAIAGRPTNRNNDDGQTVEVLRIATNGHPNACSFLLGACANAAKAIGASKILTYTLDSESGTSLRGAGWTQEMTGIKSWWTNGTSRTPAVTRPHMNITKTRWTKFFREPIAIEDQPNTEGTSTQSTLAL